MGPAHQVLHPELSDLLLGRREEAPAASCPPPCWKESPPRQSWQVRWQEPVPHADVGARTWGTGGWAGPAQTGAQTASPHFRLRSPILRSLLQPTRQPPASASAVSPAGKRKLSMLGPGSPSQGSWSLLSPWGLPPHPPCFGSTHGLVTGVLGLHKRMVIRCAGNSEKLRLSCSDRAAVLSHPPASPPGAFWAHLVPTACAQCSLRRGLGVTCPPLGLARL